MKTYPLLNLLIISLFISCNSSSTNESQQEKATTEVSTFFEQYYQEKLQLYPLIATGEGDDRYNDRLPNHITESYRANLRAFYTKYKEKLGDINRTELSENDRMSYDVLVWECDINLSELAFPTHLLPISQFGNSFHLRFAQLASGISTQPFKTVKDYDNWLKRLDVFTVWCDTAILNMKHGIAQGYVLPSKLTAKVIPQIAGWTNDDLENHLFYKPITLLPDDFSDADKKRLTETYSKKIRNEILPALKTLHDFLQTEYLPASRSTSGIGSLPNGKAYYAHQIRKYTTTNMTADEIFELGQSEVERIAGEMRKVMLEIGFEGDLQAFFEHVRNRKESMPFTEPQQVIDYYYSINQKIEPQLQRLFNKVPKTPFEVRRVEAFREKTSAASYASGSIDGTRPGIFYVPIPDISKAKGSESLFLHEAIPGHHYQRSLRMENKDLPSFMRSFRNSAFSEGWALYGESLGKELGLYTDPYQYFGMLNSENFRAARLVVDTGIHSKGWTREEAIAYCLENTALPEAGVIREIERYMSFPGQAVSYKVGQLKFLELRSIAQNELGDKFDIKAFHDIILETGEVPLNLLEKVITDWIEAVKTSN